MSLLIKALATAEKDKQKAEKSGRTEALPSDALSLSPLELELDNATAVAGSDEQAVSGHVEPFTLAQDNGAAFNNMDLSLAEEAGLISADTKPKDAPAKPIAQPTKAVTKAKSKADAFNEAAMASVAQVKEQAAARDSQKAAASVFVANNAAKTASSRTALLLLGVAGALMILLGLQGYKYIKALGVSEVVVVTPAPPPVANVTAVENDASPEPTDAVADTHGEVGGAISHASAAEVATVEAPDSSAVVKPALEKHKLAEKKVDEPMSAGEPAAGDAVFTHQSVSVAARKPTKVEEAVRRESQAVESKEPLKLVSKKQTAGVDPTLLAAYEAFNRGDDVSAQQKYRQVLQKDVRNVDALLGMAAIAQRQARNMDALGWYRKVTEIEPRNSIAQSAMADLEANTDAVGAESKIKSMLARQPEAANLHAALGNLYAAQNQWASAQAAYFSASQFAPISADYAFNLAISLEHLGKPKLALVQYQRALDLLNMTGAASPDRAQVEARVRALQ